MATRLADEPFILRDVEREVLLARLRSGVLGAAREGGEVLASITVPISADLDASAAILAARRSDDRCFCFESSKLVLAAVGQAAVSEARGAARFAEVLARCRALTRTALAGPIADDRSAPAASGPVWVGGFAFAPDGGLSPEWSSFAPAQLTMPELAVARANGQARLTLVAACRGGDSPEGLFERLEDRLGELRPATMPILNPDPVTPGRVASAAPPAHFEAAVTRAVEHISAGELTKVVLAREVRVHSPSGFEAGAVYDGLRAGFPACYCYLVGTPEATFVGASPELLVRRDGQRVQTVALAGTRRRSADPAVDVYLGEQLLQSPKDREEQAIVTRRIESTLAPVSVWVAGADQPVLVKVLNVQHLATPIRAQLKQAIACVELAGRLHPTPAVGGEPRERALALIPALEGLDRGWYAGPVGWMDMSEDGEFCVALRCALLRGPVAHVYAGEGIVSESVPVEELAANEAKLSALLPLLT